MAKRNFITRFTQSIKTQATDMLKAVFGDPAKPRASSVYVNHNVADFTLPTGVYEDWVQEAYKENETINGALNLIINTFCEGRVALADSDNEFIEVHPLLDLISHINPQDTQKRFFKQLLLDMYLGDVAYIEKVFDGRGRVTELGLLRPDRVMIKTDPQNFIDHYIYQVNGQQFRLEANEVIPIQFIDPANRFKGYSPLKSLGKRIDEDNKSTEHSMTLLQNRGQPGSIIQIPEAMEPEQAEALARSWDNRFQGSRNGQTGVLWGGMTYTPFGMSMKDLDFSALKDISEAKILSTLRIPLQVYGGVTGDKASTFNNMQEARKQFWEQAIIPLQTMIEDALNNDADLTEDGQVIWKFDRSDVKALQEDVDALSERCVMLYRSGVTTLNETRTKLGYPEMADGDDLLERIPHMGTTDLNEVRSEESKSPEAVVETTELEQKNAELETKLAELDENNLILTEDQWEDFLKWVDSDDSIPMPDTSEYEAKIAVLQEQIHCKALLSPQKKDIDDDLRNQLRIALQREHLANKFLLDTSKMMDKHFKKQIRDILGLVGTKSQKTVKQFEINRMEKGLREFEDVWTEELKTDSLNVIGKLSAMSAEQASLGVGIKIDIESEFVRRALQADSFKFAQKVSKTSAKQLRQIFTQAFTEQLSIKEVRKNITDLGDQWTDARAAMITRTETSRAANFGAQLGYKESGVVTKLQYSAILDGSTSEICQALDGKIVGIEQSFLTQDEGFVDSNGKQTDLSYTNGVPYPPAHPNCRSTIIPIVE